MRGRLQLFFVLGICLFPFSSSALNTDSTEWTIRIAVETANIRLAPEGQSPVVAALPKGTTLDSYEKKEEWFRVIIGPDEAGMTVIGYIHSGDVEVIREKTIVEPDFWVEESGEFKGVGLTVKLNAGVNHLLAGDLNKGIRGFYDSFADFLATLGYTMDERRKSFHTGFELSGEIIYNLSSRLGIGLGAGYIITRKKSVLIASGQDIALTQNFAGTPELRIVPVGLGLYYRLPLTQTYSVTLDGGPSLFLSKYTYLIGPDWKERESLVHLANARTVGFQGGIGFAAVLNRRVDFFIEGRGRYAKISDLTGREIRTRYEGFEEIESEESGTLYYLEEGKFPSFAIFDKDPVEFKTARKAIFDISGFSLRTGLTIKF